MQEHDVAALRHQHSFSQGNPTAERGTLMVMWITLTMMVVEIIAGWWFNSMALLADGWHMSSHAFAIGISAFAYAAARKYAHDSRFAFGTWKIEILAGFASAIFLLGVALMMVVGSVERIFSPQPIHYLEAIVVAILGLGVNIVCALILGKSHHHESNHGHHHDHGEDHTDHVHSHGHEHGQDDLNLKAAYLHVVADAATSVLAIIALVGGWMYGWIWLDHVMGIVGAILVAVWAKSLLAETGKVLLDREMDHPIVAEIRQAVESEVVRITDLHVWRVGSGVYACAISLLTQEVNLAPTDIRQHLSIHEELVHVTVEINHLEGEQV
jgi:cation diffusion facilitator family transporter